MSAPAVPIWHCALKSLDGQFTLPPLTVGAKFLMECSGDIAVQWKGEPLVQLPEKAATYTLVILSSKRIEATSADFIVTSYRTGQLKPEYIRVMTGDQGFEASGLEWNVQSVLKQGEQAKPFGTYGPFAVPMPIWVWFAVALVLASICTGVGLWFRKVQRRRRLADDLAVHSLSSAMTPSAQFHKELRQLSRRLLSETSTQAIGDWNAALDKAIRIYLLREFQYLTLKVPRSELFKGLRRAQRDDYDTMALGLRKTYSEMDRFQSHAVQHKAADFEQILNIAGKWCDQIEKRKLRRA